MNPMIFPKMLVSHDEGWSWLMRVHPSVARMYLLYVVPFSLVPPAMLLYAWHAYRHTLLTAVSLNAAWLVCAVFFLVELAVVPAMGAVIQRLGQVADAEAAYEDAFALAAVVPTPLWIAPLFLFVPSLMVNALVLCAALFGAAMLIYQGSPKVFRVDDERKAKLLAGSVFAAGLVGWIAMMLLTFVVWGMVVSGV
ncbi:MAG: YIP1 family protein [Rhodocyclaceae bacterium]|nr:YIP1 family protein [Rhodocyclaceae bacterium]